MTTRASFRDIQTLSTYLDGELRQADVARLESRLKADPQLRAELENLRQIRFLLRSTPKRRAPRNFTLTPRMVGLRAPTPRSVPVLRFAAAFATILLAMTFAANVLTPMGAAQRTAQPLGIGGGGTGKEDLAIEQEMPAEAIPAQEEYAASAFAPEAATQGPEADEAGFVPTPTTSPTFEIAPEAIPPSDIQERETGIIPFAWQAGLAILALSCGTAILLLRWNASRKLRKRLKQHR